MRRHANYRIPSVDFNCLPPPFCPRRRLITDRSRVSEPTFSRGFSILDAGRASVRRADNVDERRSRSNGIYCLINVRLQRVAEDRA